MQPAEILEQLIFCQLASDQVNEPYETGCHYPEGRTSEFSSGVER
jgi:hypothetical protein